MKEVHEPTMKNDGPTLEIYDYQWSNFKSHEPTLGSSFNLWSVMKNHFKKDWPVMVYPQCHQNTTNQNQQYSKYPSPSRKTHRPSL
jgi:hypothetical protein